MRPMVVIGLLSLAALISCGGCAGDGVAKPKLVQVTGTVTRGGKPVDKAQVAFVSSDAARNAMGETNAEGKFSLGTFVPGDGAIAGDHVVIVMKATSAAAPATPLTPEELAKLAASGKMKSDKVDFLPAKYSDPKTSPLRATVKGDGKDDFTFEVND